MEFYQVLNQTLDLLRWRGRVTYRALKRAFNLDDAFIADLRDEIIKAQLLAVDERGEVLVWTGGAGSVPTPGALAPYPTQRLEQSDRHASAITASTVTLWPPEAERRQLTVMFCDLVGSTQLARQLDPEDLCEIVRSYQAACAVVIERFEGHIAQYLGDGLLVYFGYPKAYEDNAHRAVRTGLEIVKAIQTLNTSPAWDKGVCLAVRIGIHTGLVVVGEVGSGGRQEQLALGEAPNIAARLQGLAAPDTTVISAATHELVKGYFVCQALDINMLKGVTQPLAVYQVLKTSGAQSRLEVATSRGLTPLVGREAEVALLYERWEQAKEGFGQVVLLSGEVGVGKSRLVQILKEYVAAEPHTLVEWRCSPYHQHSALYPVLEHLHHLLQWCPDDTPQEKLRTLEAMLDAYGLVLPEVVPLFATLLSLPVPEQYPPLGLTTQRQGQKTLEALLAWLVALATRQPVLFCVEDLHWIDLSTLELLTFLLDQAPTVRLLVLCTCRPEFHPPWSLRAHLTSLALSCLPQDQVLQMIERITGGKALPMEMVHQVIAKTDGVPLFVEELIQTALESSVLRDAHDHYELTGPLPPLAIPSALYDVLMARLDRLTLARMVAQVGAIIGRTFAYDLLQAVVPLDEAALQYGLRQLVEAELVYQRGVPPQAIYMFKHALIQDVAYQSLLRSTRQRYHQRIAQALAERSPETVATQPDLPMRLICGARSSASPGALRAPRLLALQSRSRRYQSTARP